MNLLLLLEDMTVWPSGLRRWLQAPVRKGGGSNPTAVIGHDLAASKQDLSLREEKQSINSVLRWAFQGKSK